MKKLVYLTVLALILGLVLTGCSLLSNISQVPATDQSGMSYLTKGVPLFATDLVGLWHFDGDADDSSDYGNDGTVNGADWVGGKFGNALSFDGVDDYVEVGSDSSIMPATLIIEAWIQPGKIGARQSIVSKWDGMGDASYSLELTAGNKFLFYLHDGVTTQSITGITIVEVGKWYHVAGIYDGSKASLYVTSSLEASLTTLVAPMTTSNVPLRIGASARRDPYPICCAFKGLVDEVCICALTIVINGCDTGVADFMYNGELISVQIKNIYSEAKNHGQFVRRVAVLTNDLMKDGIITGEEKGKIQSCAAQANQLPKEHGLVLWLDAGKGIEQSGGFVSKWKDQSVNGNDAVQLSSSPKPTYVTNALNGYPVVSFTGGTEQYLCHPSILSGDYTAFYVLKLDESKLKPLYYYHAGAVSSGNLGFFAEYSIRDFGWGSISNHPDINYLRTSDEYPTEVDWRIHTHQPSALYKNGDVVSYVNVNDVYANDGGLTTIGSRSDNSTLYFVGDIAEILVYDRILTVSERMMVETYLNAKYDIY
jgi:hypothetical protein